jgi:signal transduction histidine kinase/DNA-binding NarL/FixJ family response regulator
LSTVDATQPLRLLLVDDDDVDRLAVKRALRAAELPADVTEAESVAQATALLSERTFDCAVVDYNLPDGSGLEVLEAATAAREAVPTIFLTGQGDEKLAVDLMKEGARDYIPKGALRPDRFAQSLRHVIGVARAEREAKRARRGQEFLVDLSAQLAQTLDFAGTAERLTSAPVPELADYAMLHLIEEDGSVRRAAAAHVDPTLVEEIPEGEVFVRREPETSLFEAIRTGEPILLPEIDERWLAMTAENAEHAEQMKRLAPRSILRAPLKARGKTLGALTLVHSTSGRRYGEHDLTVALNLASRGALALDNARLFEELGDEMRFVETLHAFGNHVTANLDLATVVQTATDEATVLTGAEIGAFFRRVVEEERDSFELDALAGVPRDAISEAETPMGPPPFDAGFTGDAVIRLNDTEADPSLGPNERRLGMPPGPLPVRSYLAVPITLPGGELVGALAFGHSRPGAFQHRHERIVHGIARWTAVAVQNARLLQEAQHAARARDEMLAVVSHDLRNPLNVIATSASLILEIPLSEERRRTQLEVIRRTTDRMNRLIQDLLDVTGIEAGKLSIHPESLDVDHTLTEAAEMMGPLASERRLQLLTRPLDRRQLVQADRERLLQVFSNLVGNAIRFTPEGGTITLGAQRMDEAVTFYVEDTGPGIPPEDLPRLFDRFWKGSQSSGTGLGLPIAKGIVEVHGGTLTVNSAPGRGSRFEFTIPLPESADLLQAAAERTQQSA